MEEDEFFDAADINTLKQPNGAIFKHVLVHVVGAAGLLAGALVHPAIYAVSIVAIWILSNVLKKACPSVETHARTAINFHITLSCCLIMTVGLLVGAFLWLGRILLLFAALNAALILIGICLSLYKAFGAYLDEEPTNYPFAYPFFKRPKL